MQDNKEIIEDIPSIEVADVTPRDLLILAQWILGVLAGIFTIAGISEVFYSHNIFFEACKTILPPIATLVIGYYFGTSKN